MTVRWKKSLGQHLLHDQNILRKIAAAANPTKNDNIIEIGPGTGALTTYLAEFPVNLTAVELDRQFFEILEEKFGNMERFQLVRGSFLELDPLNYLPKSGKTVVTGNLPYNITSQILFRLFEIRERIAKITILIQKEVAERINADIRSKERGILSVISQFHADTKLEFTVSRNCFFPKPKVDSAVITLKLKEIPADIDPGLFFRLVKASFGKRRKTLRNSLQEFTDTGKLEEAFDLSRRPEELEVTEFAEMAGIIGKSSDTHS